MAASSARATQDIYDYRFDGYWRIGQVFHHRNANDLDVKNYADDTCFLRGQLMKLTFAPVWVQMEERKSLEASDANYTTLDSLMLERNAYWAAKSRKGTTSTYHTPSKSTPPAKTTTTLTDAEVQMHTDAIQQAKE